MLRCVAGGLSASLVAAHNTARAQAPTEKTQLGIVLYCLGIRQRAERAGGRNLSDPIAFLEHCRGLGAGGIQVPLGRRDEAYATELRRKAEAFGMFIEGIAGLPKSDADLERFDDEVRTAKQAGARAIRVVMIPGRRYERFDDAGEFRQLADRGRRSLERAEPIAARHGVPLALENHKDQRIDERLDVFRRISSQYVGACVDTGNSFALLEDPVEVIRAYAPWAVSVHLKDQAVAEYEDGFLLADVPLGDGFLDLREMVRILREAKPDVCFGLELITRDPLEVPCLTEKYWATFSAVPGRDLARTLRTVRACESKPLPQVSPLPLDEQVAREEDNVKTSLAYAREQLKL
jgi:sugar phosphate isomerase/epimerase